MGRKTAVENPVVVSVRLPKKFLDSKPNKMSNTEYIRACLLDGQTLESNELNGKQFETIKYFYDFFNELFENDVLEDYLERENLMEMAKELGGIVNG